jgi:uncharacterized membrane-anchored protein
MRKALFLIAVICCAQFSFANGDDSAKIAEARAAAMIDSINSSMKWQRGAISISSGAISLNVPAGYKFLDATQSQYVLEDLWGNLEDKSVLGMIFPERLSPLSDSAWAFVVTYDQLGYVKDEDADEIDYDEVMKSMKEESKLGNEERVKQGMSRFDLIGWAQKPYYDKDRKVLHWAREFQSEGSTQHTLNYDIRILGRKGILSMNAVAVMGQLPEVKANIDNILKMAEFTAGNKYSDYDSNIDKVAAITVGALVGGKVLAKVGILAFLGKFIKIIVIGAGAAIAGAWKLISNRRKKRAEAQYEPVAPNDTVS